MSDILKELDKISLRLSEESFLTNKGLSNEVGIHVFCYDPEDELTVRKHFDNLKELTGMDLCNTSLDSALSKLDDGTNVDLDLTDPLGNPLTNNLIYLQYPNPVTGELEYDENYEVIL